MSAFGFGFEHNLSGTFTYSSGKIEGVTKKAKLNGWAYSKSHDTYVDDLDPSVKVVHSTGTFDALKFFKQYETHLEVRLLGSGDYRIERAEVTN